MKRTPQFSSTSRPSAATLLRSVGRANPASFGLERLEPRALLAAAVWDGGGDGRSWDDAANWLAQRVPGLRDDVLIESGASVVLADRGSALRLKSLRVESGAELRLAGELSVSTTIDLAGHVTLTGQTTIHASNAIRFAGHIDAHGQDLWFRSPRFTADGAAAAILGAGSVNVFARDRAEIDGTINADRIVIRGGPDSTVMITGSLIAAQPITTAPASTVAGVIHIFGRRIGLEGAKLDASAPFKAGTILIGGDYLGSGPFPTAEFTFVDDKSIIRADALGPKAGHGGKIIVWSDNATRFYGQATARGGEQGGDGGFIETSGKIYLDVSGTASVSAAPGPGGRAGQWLMDPRNVTISNSPTSGGTFVGGVFTPSADNANIDVSTIVSALNGGTSVTVTTSNAAGSQAGDISLQVPLAAAPLPVTGAALTLRAANTVSIGGSITRSGGLGDLDVVLIANDAAQTDDPNSAAGNVTIGTGISISLGDSSFTSSGVNFSMLSGSSISAEDGIVITHTGTVSLNGTLTASDASSPINISGSSFTGTNISSVISSGGPVTIASPGAVTIGADMTGTSISLHAGTDGTGNLTFGTTNIDLNAGSISLRAGNGNGGGTLAKADAVTNTPVFRAQAGGATCPSSFSLRFDVTFADADIPAASQFGASISGMTLTLQCDDSTLIVSTPSKVAGTSLNFLTSANVATINANIAPQHIQTGPGGSVVIAGNVSATSHSYGNNVSISGDRTITAVSQDLNFLGTLNGLLAGADVILTAPLGFITLAGAVGNSQPLGSLTATGGLIQVGANVSVTGSVLFANDVRLTGNSVMTLGSGQFSERLDSSDNTPRTLTVNSSGAVSFIKSIGSVFPLQSLTTNAAGTTTLGTSTGSAITIFVTTLTLNDPTTVAIATTFDGGSVILNGTVNSDATGAKTLALEASTQVTISGVVGAIQPLASLAVTGSAQISLGANVTTTGDQSYTLATTLTADVTLTGNDIQFGSSLQGTTDDVQDLTINTSGGGVTSFGQSVGSGVSLASITTNADGTTVLAQGGTSSDIYALTVSFGDPVLLAGGPVVIGSGAGGVTFNSTVNSSGSARALILTGGVTGFVEFRAPVGATLALASLSISQVNQIQPDSITTTGDQTYDGYFEISRNITLSGNDISFLAAMDGDGSEPDLTINTSGNGITLFGGAVGAGGALGTLTTNADGSTRLNGGAITTTRVITFNDTVTLNANMTINSGQGVTFDRSVDSFTSTARTLGITGTLAITFRDPVGAVFPLASFTAATATTIQVFATAFTTTGAQNFNSAVVTSGNESIVFSGSSLTFASTLGEFENFATSSITVNSTGGGVTTFGGAVGMPFAPAGFFTNSDGTTVINGATVSSIAGIQLADAVQLGVDVVVSGSFVSFGSTINSVGSNRALTINTSGSGATTFSGIIGGTLALSSLTTNADGSTAINTTDITVTGAATLNDAVTLGANLIVTGTTTVFAGTVNSSGSNRSLTAAGSTLNTFNGIVGGTLALSALTVNGPASIGATAITCTQDVLFASTLVLTATSTIAGNDLTFTGQITSSVNNSFGLTVNSSGTGVTTFSAAVGTAANQLQQLTTNADGSTLLNGGSARASTSIGFNDPVRLGAATTLTSQSVGFSGTVDSDALATPRSLTANGSLLFIAAANIGATFPLASLTISASSTSTFFDANVSLVAATGTLTFNDNIERSGAGTLTLRGSDIVLANTLTNTGTASLILEPGTTASSIGIGGGAGAFNISALEVGRLADGWQAITIGRADGAAAMTINAGTWTDPITFRNAGAGSSIVVNGALTATGNGSFTFVGSGSTLTLNANVVTAGQPVTFNDAVLIGAPSVLVDSTNGGAVPPGGAITFGFSVNSEPAESNSLTTASGGSPTTYNGAIGVITPLNVLTATAGSGTLTFATTAVTTAQDQLYHVSIRLNADVTFTGNDLNFDGTVNSLGSNRSLTANSSGNGITTFNGLVGGTLALLNLTTSADGTTNLFSSIILTGDLTVNDPLGLGVNLSVTANDATFASTVSAIAAGRSFVVNSSASGTTTFSGAVGGVLPVGITTNADGSTIVAANVTGIAEFNDPVRLGAAVTMSGGATFGSLNAIAPGIGSLDVQSGPVTFFGAVGQTTPLVSLATAADNPVLFLASPVRTNSFQTYRQNVSVGTIVQFTSLAAGDITFLGRIDSTIANSHGASINTAGTTAFGGQVGGVLRPSQVSTDAGGLNVISTDLISVNATLTLNGDTVLANNVSLSSISIAFAIDIGGTINGDGVAPRSLSVNAGGDARLRQSIGNAVSLSSLQVTSSNIWLWGALNQTTGTQTYSGPATINSTSTVVEASSVTFGGTLNAVGGDESLTVNSSGGGTTTFAGAVGGITPLVSVTTNADGQTSISSPTFGITGSPTFLDAVTISAPGAFTLSTVTGVITFGSTLALSASTTALTLRATEIDLGGLVTPSGGQTLTLEPSSAASNIQVGGVTPTAGLDLLTSELAALGNGFARINIGRLDGTGTLSINTSTFQDPVEFRMAGPGGGIQVNGTLTGIGDASFSFVGSGSTTILNADVVTNGAPITFNDAVLIGVPLVTVGTTGGGSPGAAITFNFSLNSETTEGNSLTLNSGIGATTLAAAVGTAPGAGTAGALNILTTDAGSGITHITGGTVRTISHQLYMDAVDVDGDTEFLGQAGLITIGSALLAGGDDIRFVADEVDLLGAASGSGSITLEQFTLNLAVDIAGGTSGAALNLPGSELNQLQNGFSMITVGADGGTGVMDIDTATFQDSITVRMNGAGGLIIVDGIVRTSDTNDGTITVIGSGATLNILAAGGFVTAGHAVIIHDAILLGSALLTIDTTTGGLFPTGGDILIDGPINSASGQSNDLALLSGMNGTTTLQGPIGTTPGGRLGTLTTDTGGTTVLSAGTILTEGAQNYGDMVSVPGPLMLGTLGAAITFQQSVMGQNNVTINPGSGQTVFDGPVTLDSLTINSGNTRTFNGTVTVGVLTIFGGQVFFNDQTDAETGLIISGSIGGSGNVAFSLTATWDGGTLAPGGNIVILSSASLLITGPAKTLSRTILVDGTAYWTDGDITLDSGAIQINPGAEAFFQSGGTASGIGAGPNTIDNRGQIERSGPGATSLTNITLLNTGSISVTSGALPFTPASGTFTNAGSLILGPAETLSITGSYVQTAAGSLLVRIAGTSAGQFGRLIVSGAANLAGSFSAQYTGGFTPIIGQSLQFLTAASVTGTFTTATIPPAGNVGGRLIYSPTGVTLSFISRADWNMDGNRSAQDIFDFLASYFSGNADFNGSGATTAQDIFDFLAAFFAP